MRKPKNHFRRKYPKIVKLRDETMATCDRTIRKPPADCDLIRLDEVTEWTGFSRRFIKQQIRAGHLVAIRIGSRYVVQLSQLRIWLRKLRFVPRDGSSAEKLGN